MFMHACVVNGNICLFMLVPGTQESRLPFGLIGLFVLSEDHQLKTRHELLFSLQNGPVWQEVGEIERFKVLSKSQLRHVQTQVILLKLQHQPGTAAAAELIFLLL